MNGPESREHRVERLVAAFQRAYGARPQGITEAPGRVNLIGEHVDYNDGLVLPFAIDRSVMCAWGRSDDVDTVHLRSMDAPHNLVLSGREHMAPPRHYDWTDYGTGVLYELVAKGLAPWGALLLVGGNVPQGAGLSSSAALEVALAGALRDAFNLPIDDVTLARMCQRAENDYVGVQCGLMDQFASTLSKRDHALLIDCRTLAYEHIPLRLAAAGLAVVIANSGVKRELAASAYNARRRECGEGFALVRKRLNRPELISLRDVSVSDLESIETDSVALRRARHVVTEIARVAACVEALHRDDFAAAGALMVESHLSLRDDFEVSSEQLDFLVGLATAQEYVLGARLTGAGFGGCTVNLVRTDAIDRFEQDVLQPYRVRTGLRAEAFVTSAQDGLRSRRLD